jgi:hypothetical protein
VTSARSAGSVPETRRREEPRSRGGTTRGWASTLSRLAAWLAAGSILALAALFTLHRLFDYDVLWHVRTGQWILESGLIPRTDPFGTRAGGIPWLDVAWLAQVGAAVVVRAGGITGLQLLCAALVVATLTIVFLRSRLTPTPLAAALLFVLACGFRFLIRPDLLSLPLTILALALVERLERSFRSTLVLIALLSALWANLHGSFILAPLLLGAGLASSLVAHGPTPIAGRYGIGLLASAGAILVNPYGYRIYGLLEPYLGTLLAAFGLRPRSEELIVLEWMPTFWAALTEPAFPTLAFLLLVVLTIVSFVSAGRAGSRPRLFCVGALLLLAAGAVRNVLPFGAGALWAIARNERDALGRREEADRAGGKPASEEDAPVRLAATAALAVAAGFCVHLLLSDGYYVRRDLPVTTGVGINLESVPEGAVQWLAANETPGRLFNNYDSGAYLLYRLYPHVPIYIDSRFDVTLLGERVIRGLTDPAAFGALVEADAIGTVVLLHPSADTAYLLPRLAADSRWRLAFRDLNTTVFVRTDLEPPRPRAQPLALNPVIEPAAERINAFLARFKGEGIPASDLTDAYVSNVLRDAARERQAYDRAVARSPGYMAARHPNPPPAPPPEE